MTKDRRWLISENDFLLETKYIFFPIISPKYNDYNMNLYIVSYNNI